MLIMNSEGTIHAIIMPSVSTPLKIHTNSRLFVDKFCRSAKQCDMSGESDEFARIAPGHLVLDVRQIGLGCLCMIASAIDDE